MSAGYLVLTPSTTGWDGISEASRLIVRALRAGPSAPGARWGHAGVVSAHPGDAADDRPVRPEDPAGDGARAATRARALALGSDGPQRATASPASAMCPGSAPAVRVISMADGWRRGDRVREGPGDRLGALSAKGRFVAAALGAGLAAGGGRHVLCLHVHLSPLARLLAGRRGRLTCVLYGVEAWRPLSRLERIALRRARLIAISAHTRRRFAEANPALAARPVGVCHLGVATDAGPASAVEAADPPFALIVGRMAAAERYKGHDDLLDVWPRVLAAAPAARLVVAGDGDDRPRLEARARPLGDRVTFAGRVGPAALAALYRRAAFFAMPSRDEGFGFVYLEAMRAGRACVGARGAAAEIIEDGATGYLVAPGDREALTAALVRLFREPATRERLGRAGAARVADRFTEAHFQDRFRAALGARPT